VLIILDVVVLKKVTLVSEEIAAIDYSMDIHDIKLSATFNESICICPFRAYVIP